MDDASIRQATFAWLDQQTDLNGYALERTRLEQGFDYQGEQIRLVGPQGIFKPRCLDLPLSITTVAGGPYADSFRPESAASRQYRTAELHADAQAARPATRSTWEDNFRVERPRLGYKRVRALWLDR